MNTEFDQELEQRSSAMPGSIRQAMRLSHVAQHERQFDLLNLLVDG
jgi:hypothetical protein